MAISNIPTFTDGEILTASKMNTLGTAITTKFAGAVTGADMAWPLVAQGNIDMNNSHTFTNLRTLWKVINVNEYDTLSDAVAALPSGGGALFVPPDTTITADGVAVTKPVCVFGAGKTSVLKLTASASSGFLLRVTGTNDVDVDNLTIDGNSATGTTQDGIQLRQIDGARITNVWFKNFSGDALEIGNEGTGGNNSIDVMVHNCKFEGGTVDQIKINDVDGLTVTSCRFENPGADCIEGTPTDSSAKMRSIRINNCKFSTSARAVYIVGASGTANDLWRLVAVNDNEVLTTTGTAITVGAASATVKHVAIKDNDIIGAGDDAILCLSEGGVISGNYAPSAGGNGLDMVSSTELLVSKNQFRAATAAAIDATSATTCRVISNDVSGGTEPIVKDSTTTCVFADNIGGEVSASGANAKGVAPDETEAGAGTSGTFTTTATIPAGTVKVGDVVQLWATGAFTGANSTTVKADLSGVALTPVTFVGSVDWSLDYKLQVTVLSGAGSTESKTVSGYEGSSFHCDYADEAVDWSVDVVITWDWTKDTGDSVNIKAWGYIVNGGPYAN